ncbi:MAG: hypothetical protein MHM6MM_005120 [Cercozoa sp. M6MM]
MFEKLQRRYEASQSESKTSETAQKKAAEFEAESKAAQRRNEVLQMQLRHSMQQVDSLRQRLSMIESHGGTQVSHTGRQQQQCASCELLQSELETMTQHSAHFERRLRESESETNALREEVERLAEGRLRATKQLESVERQLNLVRGRLQDIEIQDVETALELVTRARESSKGDVRFVVVDETIEDQLKLKKQLDEAEETLQKKEALLHTQLRVNESQCEQLRRAQQRIQFLLQQLHTVSEQAASLRHRTTRPDAAYSNNGDLFDSISVEKNLRKEYANVQLAPMDNVVAISLGRAHLTQPTVFVAGNSVALSQDGPLTMIALDLPAVHVRNEDTLPLVYSGVVGGWHPNYRVSVHSLMRFDPAGVRRLRDQGATVELYEKTNQAVRLVARAHLRIEMLFHGDGRQLHKSGIASLRSVSDGSEIGTIEFASQLLRTLIFESPTQKPREEAHRITSPPMAKRVVADNVKADALEDASDKESASFSATSETPEDVLDVRKVANEAEIIEIAQCDEVERRRLVITVEDDALLALSPNLKEARGDIIVSAQGARYRAPLEKLEEEKAAWTFQVPSSWLLESMEQSEQSDDTVTAQFQLELAQTDETLGVLEGEDKALTSEEFEIPLSSLTVDGKNGRNFPVQLLLGELGAIGLAMCSCRTLV